MNQTAHLGLGAANSHNMYKEVQQVLGLIDSTSIHDDRKAHLQTLIDYIKESQNKSKPVKLNFICTHNSRRSQFAQLWASVAANYNGIDIETYSGGVEVTSCNPRTIESLKRLGFRIESQGDTNPHYRVSFSDSALPSTLFSKHFDDAVNPKEGFAAIMTCSHADENCPFVTGCEKRISLTYEDPKYYDDSPLERAMYDYRSLQIATEMMYVFSRV